MSTDKLPTLSFVRLLRSRARNIALRNATRATGMVGISDGSAVAGDTIVRFDIAVGEDPGSQLDDALRVTGGAAIRFYGGEEIARRAAVDINLALTPCGAVFVRRMDARMPRVEIRLRPPSVTDRMTLDELRTEFAPGFVRPDALFATLGKDIVGVALSEALDEQWSEVRVVVYPSHRGRGYGAAIFAALADRLEGAGRLACAALDTVDGRGRRALEHAGFRLTDYYFVGRR